VGSARRLVGIRPAKESYEPQHIITLVLEEQVDPQVSRKFGITYLDCISVPLYGEWRRTFQFSEKGLLDHMDHTSGTLEGPPQQGTTEYLSTHPDPWFVAVVAAAPI